jgi:predicted amidohydrolase YtcJ
MGRQVIPAFAIASLLAIVHSAAAIGAPQYVADLVIVNGHIVTMDAKDRVAEALAIRDGRILAVGTNALVRRYARAGTRIVDLRGHTATPGLIDTHAHIADAGLSAIASVQLADAKDIAEVQKRVAERVARLKPGAWVVGAGWDEGKLAEHRYVLAGDLDAVSPSNPVWLENTTGHYGVANHQALAMAGITDATPDPPAGTIDRDPVGRPTGVLKESARDPIQTLIPAPSVTELVDGILASIDAMHREGMTGVKDPDIGADQWPRAADSRSTCARCGIRTRLWRPCARISNALRRFQGHRPWRRKT